jgi:hypothetical protein
MYILLRNFIFGVSLEIICEFGGFTNTIVCLVGPLYFWWVHKFFLYFWWVHYAFDGSKVFLLYFWWVTAPSLAGRARRNDG